MVDVKSPTQDINALYYHHIKLGTAEDDFQKRIYNHRKSFNYEVSTNDTAHSKYIGEPKEVTNSNPTLVLSIAKKVPPYSNISKTCVL